MNKSVRTGYTLIEMSAVIGVCSILAGISVWLVHMSMQKTRDGQRHLVSRQAVARLAETFRRDVHAAVSIVKGSAEENSEADSNAQDGAGWILRLASGDEVRYRFGAGRVTRDQVRRSSADSADEMTTVSHETFKLPRGAAVSISLEPSSAPRMASLIMKAPENDAAAGALNHRARSGAAFRPVRVDAVISLTHRFQNIATVEKKPAAPAEDVEK